MTCIGLRISKVWGSSKPPQPDKPAQVSIDFAPAKETEKPTIRVSEAAREDADLDDDENKDKDDEDLAKRFMDWLASGIKTTKLDINTAKAMVHTVPDGILIVSPRIFRVFAHGVGGDYKKVQRLRINKKTTNGENIWTYDVQGERKSSVIVGQPSPTWKVQSRTESEKKRTLSALKHKKLGGRR